jgi:hypothetical protein
MKSQWIPPVWLWDGGINFRAVSTVEEAYAYLRGWRGPRAAIYDHALATLASAMSDDTQASDAREVFRRFAASENVLAEADPM